MTTQCQFAATTCRMLMSRNRNGALPMEQIERAERYLQRVREIYQGIFSVSHDKARYEDDLLSFFMHCYHIRDWIIHLNKVGVTAKQVDEFIARHEALNICADLCNGSKHCRLTRSPRSGSQPHVTTKAYRSANWHAGSGGGDVIRGKYGILTKSGIIDALLLAEQCMALWRKFVCDMEKIYLEMASPQS